MKKVLFLLVTLTLAAGTAFAQTGSRSLPDLITTFGYEGKTYVLKLENNETAVAIARHIGSRNWNLPIYGYKGFEHSNVIQYYDIPSRYVIPSTPVTVTSEKAGELYYSSPNRLILFFHDAHVRGQYTKVGEFDATDEFIASVEENPVIQGWGNLIISVER